MLTYRARRVSAVNLTLRCPLPAGPLRGRSFLLLWLADLISMTGDWALRIALPIYVVRLTGSAAAVSGVVLAGLLASLTVGPVAGVCVDRWDRRLVLVVVAAAQAVALLPLLAVGSASAVWIAAVVSFGESALSHFVGPAASALLPRLVPPGQLAAANSLNSLGNFVARLAGPAAGGVVTAAAGLSGAALLDTASFAAAALACALITGPHRAARDPGGAEIASRAGRSASRLVRELGEGLAAMATNRITRAVAIFMTTISVGEGMMSSLFAVWVIRVLHAGGAQLGWMLSAQAVGGIAGSLAGTWAARRFRPVSLGCVAMALFGLGDLVIFNYPRWHTALWPVVVLFFGIGVPAGVGYPSLMTLFQLQVPDRLRGRLFAVLAVAQAAAAMLGATAAGLLGQKVGVMDLLSAQGGGYVLAAAMLRILAGRGPAALGQLRAAAD